MCDTIQGGVLYMYMFVYVHIQVHAEEHVVYIMDPQTRCILKGWHSD